MPGRPKARAAQAAADGQPFKRPPQPPPHPDVQKAAESFGLISIEPEHHKLPSLPAVADPAFRPIWQSILDDVAAGAALTTAASKRGINPNTVMGRILRNEDLRAEWREARNARAETLADSLEELAKQALGTKDRTRVEALKLVINTRQWIASRLLRDYADKQDVRVEVTQMPMAQIDARLRSFVRGAIDVTPRDGQGNGHSVVVPPLASTPCHTGSDAPSAPSAPRDALDVALDALRPSDAS